MKRIKFVYLGHDGKLKSMICKEWCNEDYHQDPYEVFAVRHGRFCRLPSSVPSIKRNEKGNWVVPTEVRKEAERCLNDGYVCILHEEEIDA